MKTIKDLLVRLYDSGRLKPDSHINVEHGGVNFNIKPHVICGLLRVRVTARPPSEPENIRVFNALSNTDDLMNHITTLANNLGHPRLKTIKSDVSKSLLNE